jgi:2-dehydro-3-deoxygalactonokinase
MVEHSITPAQLNSARLIGVDWGSTSFRVFLLDTDGQVLATRSAQCGASQMHGAADYAATLLRCAGDWMQILYAEIPVIACGMVGSKHGWEEVPYVSCPADGWQLAKKLKLIKSGRVHLVPGLFTEPANLPPDVMRGEETQLIGAMQLADQLKADSCIILPGTHSKWAKIVDEKIVNFATHMTGELFSVLRQHSVLGRLLPEDQQSTDDAAFLRAVHAVRNHPELGLPHQLFAVRTLGLTEQLPAQGLADYLSGLLIAHEIKAGLNWRNASTPLALVGDPELCRRYELALSCFDVPVEIGLPNTAPAGLWELARAAEIV